MNKENHVLQLPLSQLVIHWPSNSLESIAPVWDLLDRYQKFWADDYSYFSKSYVMDLFSDRDVVTIQLHSLPVAVFWADDRQDDLWVELKAVIDPKYLKMVLTEIDRKDLLDALFAILKTEKLRVHLSEKSRSVAKWLKKNLFKNVCYFRSHTRKNGKKIDVSVFELRKSYWERYRNG